MRSHNYAQACARYETALAYADHSDQKSMTAYRLGAAYEAAGNLILARKYLFVSGSAYLAQTDHATPASAVDCLMELSACEAKMKEVSASIGHYRQAIAMGNKQLVLQPDDSRLAAQIADACDQLARLVKLTEKNNAESTMLESQAKKLRSSLILDRNPIEFHATIEKATVANQHRDYNQVLALLYGLISNEKNRKNTPDYNQAMSLVTNALLALDREKDCERLCQVWLETVLFDPLHNAHDVFRIMHVRYLAYSGQNKDDLAMRTATAAFAFDPRNVDARELAVFHRDVARNYIRKGAYELAEKHLSIAKEIASRHGLTSVLVSVETQKDWIKHRKSNASKN